MLAARQYLTATRLPSGLVLATGGDSGSGALASAEIFGGAAGGSCGADSDCVVAGDYCASNGTCQPPKAQGATCNLVADCKVAGCAECSSGYCVNGYCCNGPCNNSCTVCAVAYGATANGTCTLAPVGTNNPLCLAPAACNGVSSSCPSAT